MARGPEGPGGAPQGQAQPEARPGVGIDAQHSHPARSGDDRRLRDNLDPRTRSQIGRRGGEAVSANREHMAELGRRGGEARGGEARAGVRGRGEGEAGEAAETAETAEGAGTGG